jgi:hemerythrin
MAFQWTPSLETGNLTIDEQHKQLIKAINDLLNACIGGKGKEALNPALDFLSAYTLKHFGDEEKLQIQYGYPDYQNHKQIHDAFVKFVKDLVTKMKTAGPTTILITEVSRGVGDWLINHIQKEDVKVAAHIKKAAKA